MGAPRILLILASFVEAMRACMIMAFSFVIRFDAQVSREKDGWSLPMCLSESAKTNIMRIWLRKLFILMHCTKWDTIRFVDTGIRMEQNMLSSIGIKCGYMLSCHLIKCMRHWLMVIFDD